ncbi:MAG TPA: tetratricopeptide repeat protein [Candidatus Saccharimonadales bacterium]|nr:tetratricopeptide repeat protein [Candidatus Saccharimonadales bacterium]
MNEKVVQGSFKRHGWWQSRRVLTVVLIVAFLLIAGGLWWWYRADHNRKNQQTNAYTTMMSRSDKQIVARQYSTAEQIVQWYINTNPPKDYQRKATMRLASIYATAADFANALKQFNKVAALDKTAQLDTTVGIAYTYQALKDNQNAIKYFRQAITLEQATTIPDKNAAVSAYKYMIKQMGGSA